MRAFFLSIFVSSQVHAFCGFFVGKADAGLFNEASQVIVARDGERTVISMLNDFKGELKDFALVVPVPTVLKKDQVNVGEKKIFDRVDAFSAPRLVEYFDEDPCRPPQIMYKTMTSSVVAEDSAGAARARSLGVKIEASFTVGEYDIVILSAKESDGLETWLKQEGYKVGANISKALKPYILQNMKFFVAKVNLKEQAKTGFTYLRPIQFAFESPRFMLPIRLGMANANGPQDLLIYMLTPNGRVESTNYRTVKMPTGMDIPVYVKNEFPAFYKSLFAEQLRKENKKVVMTEFFWDMSWCDPCAADPLTPDELRQAGVFWQGSQMQDSNRLLPGRRTPSGGVKITRLHVRYDRENFPEDLMFQETSDNENFQGRYVLRHPWKGNASCEAAKTYRQNLDVRQESEAKNLASLTGWDINEIRKKMELKGKAPENESWWKDLWKKEK